MIFDRWYEPSDDELIYHYCRPEPLLEIMRTRSIWASAFYTMNDTSERRWGYSMFEKALNAMEAETGPEFIKRVVPPVIAGDAHTVLMLACFSLDADVLSQWRAYADDGRGFAIGFAPKIIQARAKQLRVLYDEDAQLEELMGNLRHLYEVEKSRGFQYGIECDRHLFNLGLDLCAYKVPAFHEEKEIRLCHVSAINRESNTLVSLGARGPDGERLSEPPDMHFRVVRGTVVPYVVLDYSSGGKASPIREIVLGPRNENAELNIQVLLNTLGVRDVTVRRSEAPYDL
jgi:hypothetical protein